VGWKCLKSTSLNDSLRSSGVVVPNNENMLWHSVAIILISVGSLTTGRSSILIRVSIRTYVLRTSTVL
jgi:hypothetical protein